MNPSASRTNSLDPIQLEGWRWQPFLDEAITTLEPLGLEAYPVPSPFLERESMTGPAARRHLARTSTWACSTRKLRQARAACVEAGKAASVLNFVICPKSNYNLPFFGADLVTLPSGHLLALDLQPALKSESWHTSPVWSRLMPIFKRWQAELPAGGPIPDEAQPFFSPCFLWTRLPLGERGDEMISALIRPAFSDYLDLYLRLVEEATVISPDRCEQISLGQRIYYDYRAKKDPARGMLSRFYGSEWTDLYIHRVLFDL